MASKYAENRIQRNLERARKARERAAAKGGPKNPPKPFEVEPLKPLNPKQALYLKYLQHKDQIITIGSAGTGKTFIPSAYAADELMAGRIEKIVLTRPAVGVDEDHGFLPGGMGEKIAPWVRPFTDVFQKRMPRDKYNQFMKDKTIEIIPLAYMRGLTLNNSIVILDEAQNTTYSQIKMFLTRIGEDSKVIINGDIRQTDLTSESGLAIIIKMIKEQALPVALLEFTKQDIVRSGICALWSEAFDRYEDGQAS